MVHGESDKEQALENLMEACKRELTIREPRRCWMDLQDWNTVETHKRCEYAYKIGDRSDAKIYCNIGLYRKQETKMETDYLEAIKAFGKVTEDKKKNG